MKKYIFPFLLGALLMVSGTAYAAFAPVSTAAGGTGTTTPYGILYGDNGATNHLNTVTLTTSGSSGASTFSGGVLNIPQYSGGGSPGGTSGQLQYNGAGSFAGVSTTTVSCSGSTSCTTFTAIGPSPITISSSAGGATFGQSWDIGANGKTGFLAPTTTQKVWVGQASSTVFSANQAEIGGTATTTFTATGRIGVGTTSPYALLSVNGNSTLGGYTLVGTTSPLGGTSGVFLQEGGWDNTINGVQEGTFNNSAGTSAYVCKFLNNDRATASVLNYAAWCLNSGSYTDTTFGTGINLPGQSLFQNTEGHLTLVASSTTDPTLNILLGGTNASNELARFSGLNGGSFGIGSTSPHAVVSVNAGSASPTRNLLELSYSTGATDNATTTVGVFSTSTNPYLGVGTSTQQTIDTTFAVQGNSAGSATKGTCFRGKQVGQGTTNIYVYWYYSGGASPTQTVTATSCSGVGTTTVTFD